MSELEKRSPDPDWVPQNRIEKYLYSNGSSKNEHVDDHDLTWIEESFHLFKTPEYSEQEYKNYKNEVLLAEYKKAKIIIFGVFNKNEPPIIHQGIATALQKGSDPEFANKLTEIMNDRCRDYETRILAAECLKGWKLPEVQQALAKMVTNLKLAESLMEDEQRNAFPSHGLKDKLRFTAACSLEGVTDQNALQILDSIHPQSKRNLFSFITTAFSLGAGFSSEELHTNEINVLRALRHTKDPLAQATLKRFFFCPDKICQNHAIESLAGTHDEKIELEICKKLESLEINSFSSNLARILIDSPYKSVHNRLSYILDNNNRQAQLAALEAIAKSKNWIVDSEKICTLAERTTSEDVLRSCIKALARDPRKESQEFLIRKLQLELDDPNRREPIIQEFISSLSGTRNESAQIKLLEIIQGENSCFKTLAAQALKQCPKKQNILTMLELYLTLEVTPNNEETLTCCAKALQGPQDKENIEQIRRLFLDKRQRNVELACIAVFENPDFKVAREVLNIAKNRRLSLDLRFSAIETLSVFDGESKHKRWIEKNLAKILLDPKEALEIKTCVASALKLPTHPTAIAALVSTVRTSEPGKLKDEAMCSLKNNSSQIAQELFATLSFEGQDDRLLAEESILCLKDSTEIYGVKALIRAAKSTDKGIAGTAISGLGGYFKDMSSLSDLNSSK